MSYIYGSTQRTLALVAFMCIYLSFGALTFMFLEGIFEEEVRDDLTSHLLAFRTQVNGCATSEFILSSFGTSRSCFCFLLIISEN